MPRPRTSDPFAAVRRRFERWRKVRSPGERIPARLWRRAVALAQQHGLTRTAVALGLNQVDLKRRVASAVPSSPHLPTGEFVEVPFAFPPAAEGSVTIEEASGSKLCVQLKGTATSQIEAVVRSAWSAAR